MARIVIFGGQGYLGQNIITNMSLEHQFITLGRRREKLFDDLNYEHHSIYDPALCDRLNAFNTDYFIISYYGNPSSKDIETYNTINEVILGIYQMFKYKPKLVFVSTQLVYSIKKGSFSQNEPELIDFYGAMCSRFEKVIQKLTGDNHLILRVPIVYGGKLNSNKGYNNIVSIFLNEAMKGQKLKVFGTGSQIRSFIHIEDFVLLLNKVLSDDVKFLDTCFKEYYSIRELAGFIASKFNTECEIIAWPDTSNGEEIFDIILDSSQALKIVQNKWCLSKYLNSINE